jgi:hypothetical protein
LVVRYEKQHCRVCVPLCDEDITNMDTPTVVAYNSKLKLFFSIIIIFNTCDEWTLHQDMCSMSFTEVLT